MVYKAYWNVLKIILFPFESYSFLDEGVPECLSHNVLGNHLNSLLESNLFGLGWSRRD